MSCATIVTLVLYFEKKNGAPGGASDVRASSRVGVRSGVGALLFCPFQGTAWVRSGVDDCNLVGFNVVQCMLKIYYCFDL